MKAPINPIVEYSMNQPIEKNSISDKIHKLSSLHIEFNRLKKVFEKQQNPNKFVINEMKFIISEIKILSDEIKDWEDNCNYKLVSI
jgi:hypothetical protein